ncbi:MAG: hypothetical protein EOM12_15265 [Verrucomicrobiae bacterium]|nr:hypothetical protein [Verrucomicrobiae bacterium]
MQQEVEETGGLFCVKDCSLTSIATGEDADNCRVDQLLHRDDVCTNPHDKKSQRSMKLMH